MSCKNCEEFQKTPAAYFYRIETGNVEVKGCVKHIKIMFNRLRAFNALLKACEDVRLELNLVLQLATLYEQNKVIPEIEKRIEQVQQAIEQAKGTK